MRCGQRAAVLAAWVVAAGAPACGGFPDDVLPAEARSPPSSRPSTLIPSSDERLLFRTDPDQALWYKFAREAPQRFRDELLITDLNANRTPPFGLKNLGRPDQDFCNTIRNLRQSLAPKVVIGTKTSLCGVAFGWHMNWFPNEFLSYERFAQDCVRVGRDPDKPRDYFWDPYSEKDERAYVNLDDPDVQRLWMAEMYNHLATVNVPMVVFDNTAYSQDPAAYGRWDTKMRLLRELRERLRQTVHPQYAVLCNVGVGSLVWMKDDDFRLMLRSIDGVTFEQPFHEGIRPRDWQTRELMVRYREMLDAGLFAGFIPRYFEIPRTAANDVLEARAMAAFAMCVREPGDRLFVAWPEHVDNPEWTGWPQQFGRPLGGATVDADGSNGARIIRRFEKSTMTVLPLTRRVEVRMRPE